MKKIVKKTLTVILCGVLCVASISVLPVGILFILFSLEDSSYYTQTNWNCSVEEFDDIYMELYKDKIEELKNTYSIDCEQVIEVEHDGEENKGYEIDLYNETFTIRIAIGTGGDIGWYKIDLYFYGDEHNTLDNYNVQSPYVNFINDFTNYVAYATEIDTNCFEALYYESKQNTDGQYASKSLHFDHWIGNVGYNVILNSPAFGYYYRNQKIEGFEIESNYFRYEGLLKPLY